ncbi:MAG: hypothetical protein EOO24_12190 [Comamonadaceae bacterium]|nr:MAG: hypothetical protein EOO24_12190 [Comamonadaceae bacterium]
MWKVFIQDPASGSITEHSARADVAGSRAAVAGLGAQAAHAVILWDGAIPAAQADQDKLLQEVFAANGDKVSRVTIGLTMAEASKDTALSSCPGRCFCVIAHGSRRCETYYCSASGLCYWIGCGMGC